MSALTDLHGLGQAIWLDSIRRAWLGEYRDGAITLDPADKLPKLIAAGDVWGLTSNPTIFEQALSGDPEEYAGQLTELAGADPRDALWAVIKTDIAAACDAFAEEYRTSDRRDGYVSIEVDPSQAFDTEQTVADGLALFAEIGRPNLMVKVPGTEPGLAAVTRLLAEGVNVNVTLLFSVARYEAVMEAFIAGIRRRAEAGGDLGGIASVASFFVSRVDTKIDALLGAGHPLRGQAGIANARVAYGAFERVFSRPEWAELAAQGAQVQRPLWASTGVKDPAYPDTLYVDELAGPYTVNTVPEATLDAARDHGTAQDRLTGHADEAAITLARLADEGIDLDQVTKELETEGVEKFITSFEAAVTAVAGTLGA